MKKNKDIFLIVGSFLVGVVFSVVVYNYNIIKFLNSPFFSSLVTLGVGSFVIYLYRKQQKDYKKNVAELILQEIRQAEIQIKIARKNDYTYYLADKLLPTNSWYSNIHLFVKDLKETEIDIISQFYSNSAYLDVVIGKISDKKNNILVPIREEKNETRENKVTPQFISNANKILKEVSEKIDLIYNTPAVDKLRAISED